MESDKDLIVQSSPESSDTAKQLFMLFRNWAIKYQPPKWQQIWRDLYGLQWAIWILFLFVSFIVLSIQLESGVNSYTKEQAALLLENGLQSDEVTEAVELLLSREVSYSSQINTKKPIPSWFIVGITVGLVIAILLSFKPKNLLGIGKGTTYIYRWQLWLRIISVIIPLGFFSIVIVPIIQDYIFNFFK